MEPIKVVTGAGPIGATIATKLADAGHRVRLLTRSGSGPEHPLIERLRVDVSQAAPLSSALNGADSVFHCIHGSKYAAKSWREELPRAERRVLEAAAVVNAVVVFPESLYSYSSPETVMTEDSPRLATHGKRGIRTALLAARAASETRTVSMVASDFFGPSVRTAHAGDRMVPLILAGKRVQVMGSANIPHSFTYVPDLATAMIRAAETPQAWNAVLHAPTLPALTQRELAQAFAAAAGVPTLSIGAIPSWVVKSAGIVSPQMRELAEMLYQFQQPFVMDSTASQKILHLSPTPLNLAATATIRWWRNQS